MSYTSWLQLLPANIFSIDKIDENIEGKETEQWLHDVIYCKQ